MDPAVTPPGQDASLIALAWFALTALVTVLVKAGDVLVKWMAKRLGVSEEDSQAEKLERLEQKLDRMERERDADE